MKILSGKTALITGASRGIGEAIAQVFAQAGADVVFTYRSSAEKAVVLEKKLQDYGVKAMAIQADASDYSETEKVVAAALDFLGKIDVLVNNAGITRDNLLLRMNETDWDAVMDNNLKSVFNYTKNVIKPMMKQRNGSIINISSIIGLRGQAGQANYAASKAGIIGFSKSVAQELGSRNIRCNVIAPGFIATDMTGELSEEVQQNYLNTIPLKRFGTGEDVAQVALFFASDAAVYVSGQVLGVDGGLS
ncbi:MAG: 3-oxoacyl-[acyl-carrier-protein] reductase [Chitinophagales bacterium]|nr:3-oxoacyl-[acyl-carrier-protein] reductase [Bacteroidota bacterium]MCB9043130.1 3-oxoacyl-[acyl-carrier-protein] reductase [Chitinophagales bacterium]